MFVFIEALGLVILLWFIANFVNYVIWALTGYQSPGFLFSISNHWIKQAKDKRPVDYPKQSKKEKK